MWGQGSAGLQHRNNLAERARAAVAASRQHRSYNDTSETAEITPRRHDNHLHSHMECRESLMQRFGIALVQ